MLGAASKRRQTDLTGSAQLQPPDWERIPIRCDGTTNVPNAEPEPPQALSGRKLVLETSKFNVLTAHSTREALDLFRTFPNVDAAILVGEGTLDCNDAAKKIKSISKKVPIIYLHGSVGGRCEHADHDLSSYEPEALLELVRSLFGDPSATG